MRTILIVEDSKSERELIKNYLCSDYTIIEASNGKEAIDTIEKDSKIISVIILDIIMEGMSGFDVLHYLKNEEKSSQIPVIVTTCLDDELSYEKALLLGADNFILKPYSRTIITTVVRNAIRLHESSLISNTLLYDELTGLLNRSPFFSEAEKMINHHENSYFMLYCLDVEHFKIFNDQYGTKIGDEILKHIARCLKRLVASNKGLACHYVGDKYVVLLPSSVKNTPIIEECFVEMNRPKCINVKIRTRIGVYTIIDKTLPINLIYDRASLAEESLRGDFNTNIIEYEESMRDELLHDQKIVNFMEGALKNSEFEPWFQPQFNHATGALIGAEALVRWKRDGQYISPAEFVPVFEKNGFIYEMDKFIWEKVCGLLRKWIDEGQQVLPVSINISRLDIFHKHFISVLTTLIEKYQIPVDLLRLEVTESAFSESSAILVERVNELIKLGFTVEIDDFGSGYSSLNTLKDVQASILKLDMKFFENSGNSVRGGNIIESVVRMAKWLGMSVIAEGVEEQSQADYLESIGCYYIQGYFYSKPMNQSDYEKLVEKCKREPQLKKLETIRNLDNNKFWDPKSMDSLIFNSYVGGACIFEFCNGKTELIRMNEQYVKELKIIYTHGIQLLDASIVKYLNKTEKNKLFNAIINASKSDSEVSDEYVIDFPEKVEYVQASIRVIARAEDRLMCYAVIHNITAQREAEKKKIEVEKQLDVIMKNIKGGITACLFHGEDKIELLFANKGFYEIYGYTKEKWDEVTHFVTVEDTLRFVYPEDRPILKELVIAANHYDKYKEVEVRIERLDKKIVWMNVGISVTKLIGYDEPVQIAVYRDVTAEKELNMQLQFLNNAARDILSQPNTKIAITKILNSLIEYFSGDRSYVFEFDYSKMISTNTYECCALGVEPAIESLQEIPFEVTEYWTNLLYSNSYIAISDVDDISDDKSEARRLLQIQNIDSLILVPLWRDGVLIGYAGIDNPKQSANRIDKLIALSDYITILITRRDLVKELKEDSDINH